MSDMRSDAQVIAIACADLHLCSKSPTARSSEPCWWEAMRRPLRELLELQNEHDVPVLCAGDVFDKWNASAELINFAMQELPDSFVTIAGQHDLPFHGLNEMHRSGLGVLTQSDDVVFLNAFQYRNERHKVIFSVSGFSWGQAITPPESRDELNIALIHAYCWKKGSSFPGAELNHVSSFKEQLQGYDIAIFGDNHLPFEAKAGDCLVFNCGGFMRRKSDEIKHRPSCGLIYSDGSIKRHYFDTSEESMLSTTVDSLASLDDDTIREFAKSLVALDCDPMDFEAQLTAVANAEEDPLVQHELRGLIDGHFRQ